MRNAPQVLDLQCSFLKNQNTGKANSRPRRLKKSAQMRRGAGHIITEIGSTTIIRPIRSGQFSKSIFKKTGISHTAACAAAWAMTMSATVSIGRTILAGVGIYAIIADGCAMFIGGL